MPVAFLRRTCPCTILPLPFFNFPDSPPLGEAMKILPPFKKGTGSKLCNLILITVFVYTYNFDPKVTGSLVGWDWWFGPLAQPSTKY